MRTRAAATDLLKDVPLNRTMAGKSSPATTHASEGEE